MLARASWVERLRPPTAESARGNFLKVLHEDTAEVVTRGRSWRGTPYQLGGKTYTHGLAFNSTKHILVHLAKPATAFTANVGLENNDDTRRGEAIGMGSVTFHVLADGKELFASPVLRRKDGPLAATVALNGAREFELRVKDGGDGRGWDQALWAEGFVESADGTRLRLQDIPSLDTLEANPFPFSFTYQGSNSAGFLQSWMKQESVDGTTTTWRDPASGLEVRLAASQFTDFPAVEWTLYFKNTSSSNTPLLEQIKAIDAILPVATAGPATLHWAKGAVASFDDFMPMTTELKPGVSTRLQPGGGRSSSGVLPFFNIQGATGGVISAIGWSGEWKAEFECDRQNRVWMKAGLELTHLVLHPGEEIRTPRMLVLFYEGNRWRGQNLLRQFLLAHHRVKRAGKPLMAPITCGNWGGTRAEVHLDNIRQIIRNELPIEYYWIDAEWFGQGGWPVSVGDWQVKKELYPEGFQPISKALRDSGRELLLWFEPERVFKGTPWHQAHPDWLLNTGGDSLLLNLGNPAARKFLTDFISDRVREFGLGCYRQDFNIDPLRFWRAADAPDRQGITEIRYIEGLYAFWDELLERNPGLIIDNCASGGRRIDLETIGRATPFWRTDGPRDAIAHQCHTYGLLAWVPLSATSQDRARDDYEFRSSMCSSLCLNWWVSGDVAADRIRPDFPFDWAKATLKQYLEYRQYYYGDYYPLTGYSQAKDAWMAYQMDRPDLGKGMVVALRRPESPYESASFPLLGLDTSARYEVTLLDSGKRETCAGRALVEDGLRVMMAGRPGSCVLVYRKE
jgi:alpha-galactosidase